MPMVHKQEAVAVAESTNLVRIVSRVLIAGLAVAVVRRGRGEGVASKGGTGGG